MRRTITTAAGAVALSIIAAGSAAAQERPGRETARDVTLTADVIDLSCKVVHGLSGPDHRMCAEVCADKGIPLALFVDGQVYVPVSMDMPGTGSNAQLKPFAEQKVQVTGKVIDRGGLKSIVIAEIKAAE
jgi:hypothetical protein